MNKIVQYEERPWGRFEVLSSFKEKSDTSETSIVIKKIMVHPSKRFSLQSHEGRNETWIFISGFGEAIVGEKIMALKEGEVIKIPKKTKHRVTNTDATAPLVFVEISTGNFDENDITRYEDDFGRV